MADAMSTGSSLIGRTFGQYRVESRLGAGGMATVYLANQESIGRKVAIKVLPDQFTHDPTFIERFKREVQVIARLQHPRIVPVYDYGEIDHQPYIVMAYMAGGTLREKIKDGPMSLAVVVKLIDQIADALDFAHSQGIIHRDFKPGNVLLDNQGNAYLADFGIAKINEASVQLTGSGVVGTPSYMAPEMIDKAEAAPSVDIYALGVTAYEMLTGEQPFFGETPLRVMMAHATDRVPDVRGKRPDLPAAVTHVINRVMAKKPETRYQSAREFADMLRRAAEGGTVQPFAEAGPPDTMMLEQAEMAQQLAPTAERPAAEATVPESGWSSAPAGTPPPPGPAIPAPGFGPYPSSPAAPAKKGGCSPVVIAIVAGVVLISGACIAIFFGGAILSALGGSEEVATATPEPQGGFVVINNSDQPICQVYAAGSGASELDDGLISGNNPIQPGQERHFALGGPDSYTLVAEPCNGDALRQFVDSIALSTSGPAYRYTVSGSYNATLVIANDSSLRICYFYVSSPDNSIWGPDQFSAEQTLNPGGSFSLLLPAGSWDTRGETCEEDTNWEEYGLPVEGEYTWTLTD